jgi:MFS superfamily sulfate permease-like transporter
MYMLCADDPPCPFIYMHVRFPTSNQISPRALSCQEAVAIGRTFAAMKDYQLDGNKEMVALGTMNIVGSMTSCYIATGFPQ